MQIVNEIVYKVYTYYSNCFTCIFSTCLKFIPNFKLHKSRVVLKRITNV